MSTEELKYDPKNMVFRRLGNSGLRVPLFSLGGWLTLGGTVTGDPVKDIIKTAFDAGINMFDTAETYADGQSELEMGRVLRELNIRRSDLIITTKIFFGTDKSGPNSTGLSRKHLIEGTRASLARLGLSYVDVLFAHRPDPTVPIEETVRAFNWLIDQGLTFYWATSEWSARDIEEAHQVAGRLGMVGPVAEQCQHHMFWRERPEAEYAPLYARYGMGTTTWSSLASGLLTGKYNDGIPEGSRFNQHSEFFKKTVQELESPEGKEKIRKVRELTKLANEGASPLVPYSLAPRQVLTNSACAPLTTAELQTTPAALALAWVAASPNTSTVILGASSPEQVLENLKALEVLPRLTPEILEKVEAILGNKLAGPQTFVRTALEGGRKAFY
ncbi:voltage-gated potassium channel beta-2 subunit [Ephemerocybe angulata]|uniref:Voltage-gated potassium channel beta-2 subunit n=1 Tax=Ephemerocybe angulata TaxID=980116 RepID=A0A8H6HJT2_9AGAR|nr:voltage-gated potassium channel beta-2 subunit [Tulosesus angulatus]